MAEGSDYRIKKIEKGPLQRFKNQNLLIKKFGETGLQIYKAITGKRSTQELRKDMGVDQVLFDQVLTYMQDAGMVELEPTSGSPVPGKAEPQEAPEEPAEEEEKPSRSLEEIPPEEEIGPVEEPPPLEEPQQKKAKKAREEEPAPEKIEEFDFEAPRAKKKKEAEEEITFEEIKPIEFGEEIEEPKPAKKKQPPPEEPEIGEEIEPVSEEAEPQPAPEAPSPSEEQEEIRIEEPEEAGEKEESDLSPVEKIISDKYGDVGLQVYSLIDGQRTAEEIMRETGLTEPKLVEILDFMDEQGIIKLDYPKGGGPGAPAGGGAPGGYATPPTNAFGGAQQMPPAGAPKKEEVGFNPMIEGDESLDEARAVPSPVELPIKAPMDLVKGVQMKAKLMLKFKENKGGRVMDSIDGKNDVLDISLKLDLPLFEVSDVLRFMMENGVILMKPMTRTDVRKKYGDDGYSVYKKFGKEGLMLYELIGKELTIKQMADKITTDKAKIIDMFIFIHKVLGIELPIDRDVLAKQLGV
ncbi:MAG: hypothetical protein U0R44_06955 [Candidatus Micrarchaeia archaeon]